MKNTKKITFEKLKLQNFKSIKDLTVNLTNNTLIYGDNGTGKTTIADALFWLLFDKDSKGKQDFQIKPTDSNNNETHHVEIAVELLVNIDGKKTALKKILKEVWSAKRGSSDKDFKGHTCDYFINSAPKNKGPFKEFIESLVSEDLFKMLTDPLYFADAMNWKDRRKVLLELTSDFTPGQLISLNPELDELSKLLEGKSVEELKNEYSYQKKELEKSVAELPTRIDQTNKFIVTDVEEYDVLVAKREQVNAEIKTIEDQIADAGKADPELVNLNAQLSTYRNKEVGLRYKFENEYSSKISDAKKYRSSCHADCADFEEEISILKVTIEEKENKIKALKAEKERNYSKLDELENLEVSIKNSKVGNCPHCSQTLPASHVLVTDFNNQKAEKLSDCKDDWEKINNRNGEINKEITSLEGNINKLRTKLENTEIALESAQVEVNKAVKVLKDLKANEPVNDSHEYLDTLNKIGKVVEKINNHSNSNNKHNNELLKQQKNELNNQLSKISEQLQVRTNNTNYMNEIKRLENELTEKNELLSNVFRVLDLIQAYQKIESEYIANMVNDKFRHVSFRLFLEQINGGIKDVCDVLVSGIPFNSANHGGKVNAGLDIINTLSEHYGLSVPVVIDNAESVTNYIDVNSQVIKLVVSEKDKALRITNLENENEIEKVA